MELLVPTVLFAAWFVAKELCPLGARFATGMFRSVGRMVSGIGRRRGWAVTCWLGTVCVAIIATVGGCAALARSGTWEGLGVFVGTVIAWIPVIAGWVVWRWWARRRYTPRRLPARRGRR